MAPRIPPLPREEWTDEAREAFCFWEGREVWDSGSRSTLTMTLAQHPALSQTFYPFGRQLLVHSTLPSRPRELLTMRASWLYGCEYEWAHHYRRARELGVTAEEIEALKRDTDESLWSELDLAVIQAVDQLHDHNVIGDATWKTLACYFDKRQLMDLVFTIGQYVMLSWAIASFGTEVEEHQEPKQFGRLSEEDLARRPAFAPVGAPDDASR